MKLTWATNFNIKLIGKENINHKKPTLLIVNHTNAVIDPIAIAVNVKRGIFFLARGDAFANGFLKWVLWQFHMIPIFRKEECDDNLEKNVSTFGRMFELFDKARPILIFSEGKCIQEKTIREFKKGTAHILLDYAKLKMDDETLFVQPIGLNYQQYNTFGTDLIINFGKPFTLKDLNIEHTDHSKKIDEITQKAHDKLAEYMVIQPNPLLYGMEISVEQIIRGEWMENCNKENENEYLFKIRQSITKQLHELYIEKKDAFLIFKKMVNEFENKLIEQKISLEFFEKMEKHILINFISVCLLFPFFLIACFFNLLPLLIVKKIVKEKGKNIIFRNTTQVISGTFVFFFFYVFYAILAIHLLDIQYFLSKIGFAVIALGFAYSTFLLGCFWLKNFKFLKQQIHYRGMEKYNKTALKIQFLSCKDWLLSNLNKPI